MALPLLYTVKLMPNNKCMKQDNRLCRPTQ